MTMGSLVGMMIAVLLGHEVGGEEDEHGSLDDLERALRRVSNCLSSGSEEDDSQEGSPDASSDISHSRAFQQVAGHASALSGDGEDIQDIGPEGNSPKDEGWGSSDGPSNAWPEEQGELETIAEEVELVVK